METEVDTVDPDKHDRMRRAADPFGPKIYALQSIDSCPSDEFTNALFECIELPLLKREWVGERVQQ